MGTGGYSLVKVAQNRFSNEAVAVKIIKKRELTDVQYEATLKEVQVLEKLNHQHIMQFVECFNDDNYLCIVTEWLSMDSYDYINMNFDELLERDIRTLFKMTVLGIQYCH